LLTCSNYFEYFEPLAKVLNVIPAKAGIQVFKVFRTHDFTGVTVLLSPASSPFVFIMD